MDVKSFESMFTYEKIYKDPLKNLKKTFEFELKVIDKVSSGMKDIRISTSSYVADVKESIIANDTLGKSFAKLNSIDLKSLKGGISAVSKVFKTVKVGLDFTDGIIRNQIKLGQLTDDVSGLNNSLFDMASRSRASFNDVSNVVMKIGASGKDSFEDMSGMIDFSESLYKSFKIAGAETGTIKNSVEQMAEAFKNGTNLGSELSSVLENAPIVVKALSDELKLSEDKIKELASQGEISAETLISAMSNASDEINESFDSIPATFSESLEIIKNGFLQSFIPIANTLGELLSNPAVIEAFNIIGNGIALAVEGLAGFITLFIDNWDIIVEVVEFFAVTLLPMALGYLMAMASVLWGMVPALIAQSLILLALAKGWILSNLGVLAVGIAIYAVIRILRHLGVSFSDVFKFILNLINIFINNAINKFIRIINFGLILATFLKNLFKDPLRAIEIFFLEALSNIGRFWSSFFNGIAEGLNVIINAANDWLGTNFKTVSIDFFDKGLDAIDKRVEEIAKEKGLDTTEELEFKSLTDFSLSDKVSDAFKDIFGDPFEDEKSKDDGKGEPKGLEIPELEGIPEGFEGVSTDVGNLNDDLTNGNATIGQIGSVKKEVDISSEDLKSLRDFAERQYISNFIRNDNEIAPTVIINQADNNLDNEKLYGYVVEKLTEEIDRG